MPVDFKKSQAPLNTVTRDTVKLSEKTGNVYEMVNIIAKRANQISLDLKDELSKKLQEFASYTDNLEEVFENREQREISRYYERLPKPVSIAAEEYAEEGGQRGRQHEQGRGGVDPQSREHRKGARSVVGLAPLFLMPKQTW